MAYEVLSPRETEVLEEIVRNYILTASPTASRFVAKKKSFRYSPATVRNVMGDLEERGYITHPHTSAGRIPTDKGYRHYVDGLMRSGEVPKKVRRVIDGSLQSVELGDLHVLLDAASTALSRASNQLGVVLAPKLASGVFRHVHIYEVALHRYLLHLTIDTGFVKTLVVELGTEIMPGRLEHACQIVNERFRDMTLDEMCSAGESVFSDVESYELGIIRLFIPSIKRMVAERDDDAVHTEGETNILLKPEFFNRQQVGAIVEILGEKKLLMHVFERVNAKAGHVTVSIGGEIASGQFSSFSIVKTRYQLGNMEGSLGVIGPKRMPYPLLLAVVDYTARALGGLHAPVSHK
jgi:heat-inducible transcriptional repressor